MNALFNLPFKKTRVRTMQRFLILSFLAAAVTAFGQNGSFQFTFIAPHPSEHHSIAPVSIPVGSGGVTDIGMTAVSFRTANNGDTSSISKIELQAISDGSFNDNWVSAIRVYFEAENDPVNNNEYDHGAGADDVRADTGGPYTFSSGAATINLDPTIVQFTRPGGGPNYLYVVFDLTANADTTSNLGCEVTRITYGLPGVGTPSTIVPTVHNTKENLDDYTVTASASGEAPPSAAADATNVPVFLLDLSLADSLTTAHLKSVKVHRTAGADNYVAASGVLLYVDDGDGILEPGADDGTPVATATLGSVTAGYATLTLATSVDVPAAGQGFFAAVNLDSNNAVVGNTFGLEVENPAADITFEDTIEDDNDLSADYAYIAGDGSGLYEYDQEAYVDPASTTAVPVAGNSFTITPVPDVSPPQVLATTPAIGATDIEPDTLITIVFSQYMLNDASANGVLLAGNYELRDLVDDTTVALTPTYNSSAQTLTLTPGSTLDWATTYRVTLYDNLADVDGQDLFDQYVADYQFTFVTRPEFPVVNEPTAIKNRIGTGVNSETVILIPTPPKGATEKISVQVFTTTGKLVKTFCKNVPYSTITDGRYIWNGTNDRGDALGPGMYFVQVRTESYKRVLKVMIVR